MKSGSPLVRVAGLFALLNAEAPSYTPVGRESHKPMLMFTHGFTLKRRVLRNPSIWFRSFIFNL